jgi:hypothetical protein
MLFPTDVLSAVLCAIVGAAIMQHSHPNSYSVLWSARVAAVGGAILGIPLMLFAMFLESLTSALSETNPLGEMVASAGEFALGAASSAGAAALGCKVLILSLGAEKVKQGIKESASLERSGRPYELERLWPLRLLCHSSFMEGSASACCGRR